MGLFSSIAKLFRKDSQVAECCRYGVCICSSDGNNMEVSHDYRLSDSTAVTTTSTSSEAATFSSPPYTSFTAVTEDEINIALETAAEADRIAAEDYISTPPPDASLKKRRKKSKAKKSSSKLNRK